MMYALYYFNIFYHTWVVKRNHFKYTSQKYYSFNYFFKNFKT